MLHKDLTGLDLHIPKLHAPTHLVGGTDPLGLAESEITGLVTDLGGKAPVVHAHVKADITDFPTLGTAAALNVDADISTLALPANTTISAAGAELINDADAAAQLVTLGAMPSSGAWTAFTPTVTASIGTITTLGTVAGKWVQIGKTVSFSFTIHITTNGTGAQSIVMTLPIASKGVFSLMGVGFSNVVSGKLLYVVSWGAASTVNLYGYDNTYPGADGCTLVGYGTYEAA